MILDQAIAFDRCMSAIGPTRTSRDVRFHIAIG
jgi:hypothetical protein